MNQSSLMYPIGSALVALSLAGCSIFDFDVTQNVPQQRVPGSVVSTLLGGLVPSPFPLTIDFAQETKKMGTGPVKSAGLTQLSFQITPHDKPVGTFDFVQSVEVDIESTAASTTLPKQKIAELTSVPPGATTLMLTTHPEVNLVPYINEGNKVTSQATGRAPSQDVTFDGVIVVHVHTF